MLLGIDIGGTFTDGAYLSRNGNVVTVKTLSTPEDRFVGGFFNVIEEIARRLGKTPAEVLRGLDRFTHGSTIAVNTIIEGTGAKVGMITTKGHRDVLKDMLGKGRVTGRTVNDYYNILLPKPKQIVPDELIVEVAERIDSIGEVVVELNEEEAEEAIRTLLRKGIEVLAVCFLWSFHNPDHELRAGEICREEYPEAYLSLSHEIAPILGEYLRFQTTTVNAYVGPIIRKYMTSMP